MGTLLLVLETVAIDAVCCEPTSDDVTRGAEVVCEGG
jgi:hypothetical protein